MNSSSGVGGNVPGLTDAPIRLVESIRGAPRRNRFVTHLECSLEERPGVSRLLEYEASANAEPIEDPVLRVYDLGRFGGATVVDVMRTHPAVLIGEDADVPQNGARP